MEILGISGSHRKGNSEILVKKALEVCREKGYKSEFISLAGLDIGYYGSEKNDIESILDAMVRAEAIIIGSPTYFASVSGKLKSLFDWSLLLRKGYKLSGKLGGAIAVGGSRNGGQEFVTMQIHNWMLLHEMIVVSDKNTAHFGGIAVGKNPGDVLKDDIGIKTVENLAVNIIEALERRQ